MRPTNSNQIHVYPQTPQNRRKNIVQSRTNYRFFEKNNEYNANNPYLINPTTNSQVVLQNEIHKKGDSYSQNSSTKSLKNVCMHELKVLKKPVLRHAKVSKINSQENSIHKNKSNQHKIIEKLASLQQQNRELKAQNHKLKKKNEMLLKEKHQQVNTLNRRMEKLQNIILDLQAQLMKSSQYTEER